MMEIVPFSMIGMTAYLNKVTDIIMIDKNRKEIAGCSMECLL